MAPFRDLAARHDREFVKQARRGQSADLTLNEYFAYFWDRCYIQYGMDYMIDHRQGPRDRLETFGSRGETEPLNPSVPQHI